MSLLKEQLACIRIIVDGDEACGWTEDRIAYSVSLRGLGVYLSGVTEGDVDATFPGLTKEEAGLRLLGIALESIAADAEGAVVKEDGSVERVGSPPRDDLVAPIDPADAVWSAKPGRG